MSEVREVYEFADFRFDTANQALLRNGENVPITRKMFETLNVLVENAGHTVEKQELIQRIWHDRFVEESNLTFNIKMLRKALGDSAEHPSYIETIPRRGYRFISQVRKCNEYTETTPACSVSNGSYSVGAPETTNVWTSRRRHLLAFFVGIVLIGSAGLVAWIWKNKSNEADAPILSAEFSSIPLSETGKVRHAVISPNGEYVAYTNQVGGKDSLWLRHLETSSNTQINPPSDEIYYGLAFSNDSKTLFFTRKPAGNVNAIAIYRVPLFGGVPTKIADRSQGWIGVSPDNKYISFVRYESHTGDFNRLILVDTDGGNEREVRISETPNAYWVTAFSPDGEKIAVVYGHSRNASQQMGLVEVDVRTGDQHEMMSEKFFHIRDVKWLPNKSGLIFAASQTINDRSRIWKLDYKTAVVSPITNDSIDYYQLSLTQDADRLVAITGSADFHLYLQDQNDPKNFRNVTQARDKFAFGPDGRIVYATDRTGNEDIWLMNADGTNQVQLTNDKSLDFAPLVSPDNRYIFFTSNRAGESHVWRMNHDGSNQVQLTRTEGGYPRFITPDGGLLYYQSAFSNRLWQISTSGGEETLFSEDCGFYQAFSPDGSLLGCLLRDKETNKFRIKVLSPDNQLVTKVFETPAGETGLPYFLRWRNNATLAYSIDEHNTEDSLWEQRLNENKPRKQADLGNEDIMDIQYSSDGESFGLIRGNWKHDSVLLTGLR